jgi:transposase
MVATDGEGTPLAFLLAAANHAEVKLAPATLERIRVPRRRGRPRKRPEELVADRGYDSDPFREWLRRKGIRPCIPQRKNRKGRRKTWEEEYKERWHVERTFAWLGNYRRLVVRYERSLLVYEGFFTIACIMICLGRLLK